MTQKIIFTITSEGLTFEGDGFKGGRCLTELKELETYLKVHGGIETNMTEQVKKPEMFSTENKEKAKW